MDVHKPKPVHSWRAFTVEIATIVLGVLIALGAEQVAEGLRVRHQVRQDMVLLARELSGELAEGVVRMRMTECVDARLNALAAAVDEADRAGRLPPMPVPGRPRTLVYTTAAWTSVVASPAATHLPHDQFQEFAYVYGLMSLATPLNDAETTDWSEIYSLAGPGRRLDAGSAQRLLVTIADARTINLQMATIAAQLAKEIDRLDLRFDADSRARIRRALTSPMAVIDTRHVCTPVHRDIPPNYGQSPWADLLPRSAGALRTLRTRF
jgi:hypothetical protein